MASNNGHIHPVDSGAPLEKDFSGENGKGDYDPYRMHLEASHDPETALKRVRTAGSVSISPELFEKLYLSPPTHVKGGILKQVGNPTPVALIGFLISATPLSMDLMKWRGASGTGAWGTAMYLFFGGFLMALGGLGELIIGNTFPAVVFLTFAAFWFGFSCTLQPFYNAYGAYSINADAPAEGLQTPGFNSGFAFFLVAMGIFCLICLVCSLRTNAVFFGIFFMLCLVFALLAGAYFQLSNGNAGIAGRLQEAAGACFFVCSLFGWWQFVAIMLASLDFPWSIPVGDLSNVIKGASERKKIDKEA